VVDCRGWSDRVLPFGVDANYLSPNTFDEVMGTTLKHRTHPTKLDSSPENGVQRDCMARDLVTSPGCLIKLLDRCFVQDLDD
jgi:hypothetical protein